MRGRVCMWEGVCVGVLSFANMGKFMCPLIFPISHNFNLKGLVPTVQAYISSIQYELVYMVYLIQNEFSTYFSHSYHDSWILSRKPFRIWLKLNRPNLVEISDVKK